MDYDDWLEQKTQKEIERQSQLALSPKSVLSVPKKDGYVIGSADLTSPVGSKAQLKDRARMNQTYQVQSAEKLGLDHSADGTSGVEGNTLDSQAQKLAEDVSKATLTRPKTRGDPVIKNLNDEVQTPTGELSSKKQQSMSGNFSSRRKTHESGDTGSARKIQQALQQRIQENLNSTTKAPLSPNKRFGMAGQGATTVFGSKGMITSEIGAPSKASMTNLASSLRDDDMLISTSQVDLSQKNGRPKSKLDATDKSRTKKSFLGDSAKQNLVIQEESSSLKSVSPLTANSQSRKSLELSQGPSQDPPVFQEEESGRQPAAIKTPGRPGLPPKSPFQIKASKVPQPKQQPPKEVDTANYVSFSPSQNQNQNNLPPKAQQPEEPDRNAKPALGERNPAIQDFLAFEDSDDDGIAFIQQPKKRLTPRKQQQSPQVILSPKQRRETDKEGDFSLPEILSPSGSSRKEQIRLSPARPSLLAKTPSAQFEPNTQFLKSNPNAMPALTPFEKLPPQAVAKTPNTGLSSSKVKALALKAEQAKKNSTAHIPAVPLHHQKSIDRSVDDQVDQIDYNQSNDGMSASFYRHHDQWVAIQNQASIQSNTLHGGQRSLRSSRGSSRQQLRDGEDPASRNRQVNSLTRQAAPATQQADKIVTEALQANEQLNQLRKSVVPTDKKPLVKRDEELRTSGTGTAGYIRPTGYLKKALQQQSSKSKLEVTRDSSLDNKPVQLARQNTGSENKFVTRDGSRGRAPLNAQNTSIISSDGKQKGSGDKKQQFFSKHKDSIGQDTLKNATRKKERSDSRGASRDRLYNQETIASILKRNPELAYSMKDKKPPAAPPRRPKKKIVKPPTPEPPREDPPEEPLVQSPRVLLMPAEAGVPNQESAPSNMPIPMRLPEEPPLEPTPYVMPNLYCPVDPDTPYNFEIEPREEETPLLPPEPVGLRIPIEPEDPPYPEKMIKSSTDDIMVERLELEETISKPEELNHDDEPALEYPRQEHPLVLPPQVPSKFEPASIIEPTEAALDDPSQDGLVKDSEPTEQFLTVDQVCRPEEGCQANLEESKDQRLDTVEEEASDEDNFSVHSAGAVNKVTVGIQTNEAHFRKVARSEQFAREKQARLESTDWALSPLFDEIHFAKAKKTIGGRKLVASVGCQMDKQEQCGNQVEERQIIQETQLQILSQIECEYNVDQLKRKLAGKDAIEDERLTELYKLGLNTLQALMMGLRLEKEWEFQIKQQYALPESGVISDQDETIKLLTRNKKMYESKTLIQRLLKMIVQRDDLVAAATKVEVPETRPGNIPIGKPQAAISRESLAQIKRLSTRITSQINTLQEEHRIFKRPFILHGQEYLSRIQDESTMLDNLISQKYFVDDSGTAGSVSKTSAKTAASGL